MRRKPQPTESDQAWGMGIVGVICLPLFGWLGFKCSDIDFLRPAAWIFLSIAFGIPALVFLVLLWAMIPRSGGQQRKLSLM